MLLACVPSMAWSAWVALNRVIVVPPVANARFSPISSSKAVAVTATSSERPGADTVKVAVSLIAFSSAACASVTGRQTFQLAELNS